MSGRDMKTIARIQQYRAESPEDESPGQRPGNKCPEYVQALKGRHTHAGCLSRPFRAQFDFGTLSQGVALGCHVLRFQRIHRSSAPTANITEQL